MHLESFRVGGFDGVGVGFLGRRLGSGGVPRCRGRRRGISFLSGRLWFTSMLLLVFLWVNLPWVPIRARRESVLWSPWLPLLLSFGLLSFGLLGGGCFDLSRDWMTKSLISVQNSSKLRQPVLSLSRSRIAA